MENSFEKGTSESDIPTSDETTLNLWHDSIPPTAPPRIRFYPPLCIQRKIKIHELLRELSRDYEAIQSVLEVGCGSNTPLMQNLATCDDELPLSILSGIDVDEALFSIGSESAFIKRDYGDEDRWRDLTISLIHGSFEHLTSRVVGEFDAISSSEVIEHLDSEPLANFAPVLLGEMNPKYAIVTTPNRDFNAVFEMPFEYLQQRDDEKPYIWDPKNDPDVANRRFYREPHKYAMRHDDHRFEWTRSEFQDWGNDAAETFGYTVSYHGCGALRDDAEIQGIDWAIEKALIKQMKKQGLSVIDGQSITTELLSKAFGYCSQIAVFVRNDMKKKSLEESIQFENQFYTEPLADMTTTIAKHIDLVRNLPSNLQLVKYRTFQKLAAERPYPPSIPELFDLQRLSLKFLLPVEVQRMWQYKRNLLEDEKYNFKAVIIKTDLKTLWESSYALQRACRFHLKLFEHLMSLGDQKPARKEFANGSMELNNTNEDIIATEKYGSFHIELERIVEGHLDDPVTAPQGSHKADEGGDSPGVSSSNDAYADPTISATVYWRLNDHSSAMIPQKVYIFPVGEVPIEPDTGVLVLDGPIESMREYEKKKKQAETTASQTSQDIKNANTNESTEPSSIPVAIVFFGPTTNEEMAEYDDYAREAHEALGNLDIEENNVDVAERTPAAWETMDEYPVWEAGGEESYDDVWTGYW